MEEYKTNSNKSKEKKEEPEKKYEKVISGSAEIKKKSGAKKFADVFVSEDVSNVKSYIFMDVLVPAIKKAIFDMVTNGIDMALYGETGHSAGRKGNGPRPSYRSYYDDRRASDYQPNRYQANVYQFKDISFSDRGQAEIVLQQMREAVDYYGTVKVGDMYDMAGITGDYTDYKYGWTDLRSAQVVRDRNCFYIDLPKAMPL